MSTMGSGKMEGWLYLISCNRIGVQYAQKRYFVLEDHFLMCFKSFPVHVDENPMRIDTIGICTRVEDNGRERIQQRVLFVFTVYNSSNHDDQLKVGARSSDEAARWMYSLKKASSKQNQNQAVADFSWSEAWPVRSICSSKARGEMASDVAGPSPWRIFNYQKGIWLFKEAKIKGLHRKWKTCPAVMAVGVVDESSEVIFQTLMSLGPSRSEWDFYFYKGFVIEHLDGHNDIVHKLLHRDWLPRGMKPRDLLLRRYWRRDDDGKYVILYHSAIHEKCPTEKGYVRACLKSGGFVISPLKEGKQSVVKHMLAIDWKSWKSCLKVSSGRSITIHVIRRLADLREMFRSKSGDKPVSDFSSGRLRERRLTHCGEEVKLEGQTKLEHDKSKLEPEDEEVETPSEYESLVACSEATDDFFDASEHADNDLSENVWPDFTSEMYSQDSLHNNLSTAILVKRLHNLAAPKRGCIDQHEMARKDGQSCNYDFTLPKDPSCNLHCSWTEAEASTFLIRGKTYLEDRKKIKAKRPLMQMVAADWLKSDKREDDLAGRPGSIVEKYASRSAPEFFFIVNMQIPGATTHNLAMYYMMSTPVRDAPLLDKFINGDDTYRNSRFKLIPSIFKGPWVIKQTIPKKPSLIGQALEINYFQGNNYLEVNENLQEVGGACAPCATPLNSPLLGIDVGSSALARRMAGLSLSCLNIMVADMAFLIQGNSRDELPELLVGTCRLSHLDPCKAISVKG